MSTFGGYGMAVEYGTEREFGEALLPLVAPTNPVVFSDVAGHVLGMPRAA